MNKLEIGICAWIAFWIMALAFGGYGWVMNIVKLIQSDFVVNGMMVARAAGIVVAPLGAVLGYL